MMWIVIFLLASAGVIWMFQGTMMVLWSIWEIIRQTIWPD